MSALVLKAAVVAARAHRGQKRKGRGNAAYIEHPLQVAEMVSRVSDDPEVLAAAVLHDVLEDSELTHSNLDADFASRVAGIAAELTDDPSWADLPLAERKQQQAARLARASDEARMIKIADQTCNLSDLATEPEIWPTERHLAYRLGAMAIVAECRSASAALADLFDAAVLAHRRATAA